MVTEGLSEKAALDRIWLVDVVGLLTDDRTDLSAAQRAFAQPAGRVAGWGLSGAAQLADVVHHVDVGVLLGLSTAAGAFTEDIVREIAGKTAAADHLPAVQPDQPRRGTPRRTGPVDSGTSADRHGITVAPVRRNGVEQPIAQCNNVYIFPAMGLAVTAAQATRVTDEMMRVAAATLGEASPALSDPDQPLLPAWPDVPVRGDAHRSRRRRPSRRGRVAPKRSNDELTQRITQVHWTPEYPRHQLSSKPDGYSRRLGPSPSTRAGRPSCPRRWPCR